MTFLKNTSYLILLLFCLTFISPMSGCKAKSCAALEDAMEGYNPRKVKKKKGRQEGIFSKKQKSQPWN